VTLLEAGNTSNRYLVGTNRLAKHGEALQLDGLGSMRQGLNMSNGTYTGQTDYSAFGEVIGGSNTGASQSVYQWQAQSGYRMDGASGRDYPCQTGTFGRPRSLLTLQTHAAECSARKEPP